jgi:hypothetical protein
LEKKEDKSNNSITPNFSWRETNKTSIRKEKRKERKSITPTLVGSKQTRTSVSKKTRPSPPPTSVREKEKNPNNQLPQL